MEKMQKTRREFLKTAGSLVTYAGAISIFPDIGRSKKKTGNFDKISSDKPNILLIALDDARFDTLACMGYPHAISPNLDRLVKEGITFENAHASSPVCQPARCSLLTGVHTPTHRCIENAISRRTDLTVFPDLLKERGYFNIIVGKTHFEPVPESFNVQKVINMKGGKDNFYTEHLTKNGFSTDLKDANALPDNLFFEPFFVDTTIQEIEKVIEKKKEPFFAFCSFLSPHAPFIMPKKWQYTFKNRPLPPVNYREGEFLTIPQYLKRHLNLRDPGKLDMMKVNKKRRLYYSLSAYCDYQIGRLIQYLDENGLREKTLVIYSSDHGTTLYDHGFDNKHNYYDSSWRIPLIMSMPGTLPKGQKRDFAIWNDITTTILAAAGTSCSTMQGFDLFTPLCNSEESPRKCAVSVHYKQCALATKRWKLIYYFEYGTGSLFDRKNDPMEQKNLYNNSDYSDVRNELLHALLSWRGDLSNIQDLIENTHGGLYISKRAADHTRAMKGIDAELRLNNKVEKIDSKYS